MKPPDDETFKVGCYELSFHWRDVNEYRVREKRASRPRGVVRLSQTTISLINRAYRHRGRMLLSNLPFDSWRACAKFGKALRRLREA